MLTCHGCMRHCLQTIIGDSAFLTAVSRPALTSSLNNVPLRRSYTGTSYERSRAGQEANRGRFGADISNERWQAGNGSGRDKFEKHSPAIRNNNDYGLPSESQPWRRGNSAKVSPRTIERKKWLDSRGVRPPSRKEVKAARTESDIRHHLSLLNDPLKLADFVRQTLRKDDFAFAEEIVRAASKNTLCVISWNHLVEWQLSKGKMKAAISTFNEMKKRAQVPDAYTYTILFRGCADHKDSGNALAKVMDIYHGMLAEKSPVKPNTIHMNCVLKMCSKAGNIDALFGVASQFARHGLAAPNNLSFTIMLNALRQESLSASRGSLTPMEKRARFRDCITRSRDVWTDVVDRWRKGDLWIDEELVATMGRLLLNGQEDDWDDIFSLIEQTMNIPRQVPRLGTPDRARIEPAQQSQELERDGISKELQADEETPEHVLYSETQDGAVMSGEKFEAIKAPVTKEDGIAMYAKPGQNSLSLLLKAALQLNLKAPATAYWDIFTKTYLVQPDGENFHSYLRVLRLFRASTEMLEVLSQMSRQDMEVKTFRLAMSTCARDKRNPNAFSNAGKVLDLMTKNLPHPDIQALEQYLEVAIDSPARAKVQNAQGEQILRALERLNPSFLNLKSAMQFTGTTTEFKAPHARLELIDNIIRLAGRMIRAFDHLMNKALVPREMFGDLTKQRSKISAFITRYQHIKSDLSSPRRLEHGSDSGEPRSEHVMNSDDYRQSPGSMPGKSQTSSRVSARA
ncbi:hypothetical protein ONS95_013190 [Cadophora gregata]|uniref:uncharacterized protein n=1 Tax=Cadophora gregata TaxID=51156 RepID=UPI0026DDC3A3|nr:uncharacterized protein ONS95_013190 [Cadophora gregata]KAK0099992.1 hypothetical protein ONS96_007935 [Cadophora gregata f. sp. sojae]KAK0116160.1 hypothetical protein ONS95_013190 [Cadophora gregata]